MDFGIRKITHLNPPQNSQHGDINQSIYSPSMTTQQV